VVVLWQVEAEIEVVEERGVGMWECSDFRRGAMILIRYLYAFDTIRATGLRLFQFFFSSSKDAKGVERSGKMEDEDISRFMVKALEECTGHRVYEECIYSYEC
jgi:hypothetical protein